MSSEKLYYTEDLNQIVEMVCGIMHSDNHVRLNKRLLSAALEIDFIRSECFPTEQEAETLVYGDELGEIPGSLSEKFHATHDFLSLSFDNLSLEGW